MDQRDETAEHFQAFQVTPASHDFLGDKVLARNCGPPNAPGAQPSATLLGGRIYPHGIGGWGPWEPRMPFYTPEEIVDAVLSVYGVIGDQKVRTAQELVRDIRESVKNSTTTTLWIHQSLEEVTRQRWHEVRLLSPKLRQG